MGIKDLGTFLKNYNVTTFCKLDKFKGKRIAIDTNAWIYSNVGVSRKHIVNSMNLKVETEIDDKKLHEETLKLLKYFIVKLAKFDITPIFVFDGDTIKEKLKTKDDRIKVKQNIKEKIIDLKDKLSKVDLLDDSEDLENDLKTKMRSLNVIKKETYNIIRDQIQKEGFPILTAKGDGEKLCSLLCIEGKVSAVYSPDLDNLVYGCPILIRDIKGIECECIEFYKILLELEMTKRQFVDFCIMSGCDYNERIRNIGSKKSFNFIKEFKSIENIPQIKDKLEILDHEKCRELFTVIKSEEFCDHITFKITNNKLTNSEGNVYISEKKLVFL